ncbi:MAG TPA: hypothetical protein VG269_21320 [Tepidisphaeraceae bacterium]|jgi:hypothetical protein|nr:hypothetical protein [Tepidisphaeraceae bacterium]
MADTRQIVRWALEQTCGLRPAAAMCDPAEALNCTERASAFSEYTVQKGQGFGLLGDVCVTRYASAPTFKRFKGGGVLGYPHSGFVVSREFERVGGVEGLVNMCRRCPANATPARPAGCAGVILQNPDSPQRQQKLEGIISRLGLEAAVAEAFQKTQPLWYGFWVRSPLSAQAIDVLYAVISEILDEDTIEIARYELRPFIDALRIAQQGRLKLHVSMSPPGHTDFGRYTVFPHCPACKAGARVEQWQKRYPTNLYTCHVCGTKYRPAETASSENEPDDDPGLSEILGREQFREFAKAYLIVQGLSEIDAATAIEEMEHAADQRRAKDAEAALRAARKETYVQDVLYAGLHPVVGKMHEKALCSSHLFAPGEFSELLRRCREKCVAVSLMFHRSDTDDLGRATYDLPTNPEEVFAKWKSEGCNELFGAWFNVPDDLL